MSLGVRLLAGCCGYMQIAVMGIAALNADGVAVAGFCRMSAAIPIGLSMVPTLCVVIPVRTLCVRSAETRSVGTINGLKPVQNLVEAYGISHIHVGHAPRGECSPQGCPVVLARCRTTGVGPPDKTQAGEFEITT